MIRLTLVNQEGTVTPDSLAIAELREVQEQARKLIRECERLLDLKNPKKPGSGVPYV